MDKKFPNLLTNTNPQILSRINTKRSINRDIIVKMLKAKYRRKS